MFHRVHRRGDKPKGQWSISDDELEMILHAIGLKNILSPQEWLTRLKHNTLRESDRCLTFDDGLKGQVEAAVPVLDSLGLTAFFFVYSCVFEKAIVKAEVYSYFAAHCFSREADFLGAFLGHCYAKGHSINQKHYDFISFREQKEREFPFYCERDIHFRYLRDICLSREEYEQLMDELLAEHGFQCDATAKELWMTNEDLRRLFTNGHCVGLHSYDHPTVISRLNREAQAEQYRRNLTHLERECGRVTTMAHPCGDYNSDTLDVLRGLGIECGFCSNLQPPRGEKLNPSCLEIAREDCTNLLRQIRSTA